MFGLVLLARLRNTFIWTVKVSLVKCHRAVCSSLVGIFNLLIEGRANEHEVSHLISCICV